MLKKYFVRGITNPLAVISKSLYWAKKPNKILQRVSCFELESSYLSYTTFQVSVTCRNNVAFMLLNRTVKEWTLDWITTAPMKPEKRTWERPYLCNSFNYTVISISSFVTARQLFKPRIFCNPAIVSKEHKITICNTLHNISYIT